MKHFVGVVFFLCCFYFSGAQLLTNDTVAYKTERYENKKQLKVSALAEKLKVDPAIIVKLNRFRSDQSVVVKGQRIKIPIYPKGYKYASDRNKMTQVNKQSPGAETKGGNTIDSGKSPSEQISRVADTEKDRVRLIMIEAILELNEAMMEGIKTSLDSLDVKNESSVTRADAKKLSRDRTVLMPYILHVQDSLSKEIAMLKEEKEEIINKINPPVVTTDTVFSDGETVIYDVTTYSDGREPVRMVKKVIAKTALKEKTTEKTGYVKAKPTIKDTVIVYDMPVEAKHSEKGDVSKIKTWEPARALKPVADFRKDTTIAIKIKLPDNKDSIVIKPAVKRIDSIKLKQEIAKVNTRRIPLSNVDSVKRIKAEFFLKRAQKALKDKDFKTAETYLQKSTELYPKYFDAWFAYAEMYQSKGLFKEALKEYQTCGKIDESNPKLYLQLGNLYMSKKQKTEAAEEYNKAIQLSNDYIPALMARASISADLKKYSDAVVDYDKVLKADRLYHLAYKLRGQAKMQLKEFNSAVDDFTRFLIFESTDPSAFYYRGLAKIANNELLDGCLDLSTSAGLGYTAAEKAIKKSCE